MTSFAKLWRALRQIFSHGLPLGITLIGSAGMTWSDAALCTGGIQSGVGPAAQSQTPCVCSQPEPIPVRPTTIKIARRRRIGFLSFPEEDDQADGRKGGASCPRLFGPASIPCSRANRPGVHAGSLRPGEQGGLI